MKTLLRNFALFTAANSKAERGAERGVDIAVEESGSKGFTNETILITSHGNERCSVLVVSCARR